MADMRKSLQILKQLGKIPDKISIGSYANGRENGIALFDVVADKNIVFSEHKTTDAIQVISGQRHEFEWYDYYCVKCAKTDEKYKETKYFNTTPEAVLYIKEKLGL